MNCENFLTFSKYFEVFRYECSKESDKIIHFGENNEEFVKNIGVILPQAKIFEVDEDVKKLLCLTDTPIKNDDIHLPFGIIFLDVHFCKEELANLGINIKSKEIIGAIFQKGVLIDRNTKNQVGSNLRITVLYIQEDGEVWFDTYNKNNNLFDKENKKKIVVSENPTTDKKSRDFIHKFILNFLNFVNNPDIKIVEQRRSEQNVKRRLKQGKATLPSSYRIFLKGELKVYIERICNGEKFKYNHKFWVRGHFRRLESERYKERKIIWVLPFLKGKGILIDKTYHLEKNEN